ncbi:MAG: response regulator [Candidatus Kerfeldbacteria bacterium]|nr:response regulator [Candidatus Kerfeldbacteria bacterium]
MVAENMKVLVVEDEKMLAEMYATKFTMEGFSVEKANDGSDGLAKAKATQPDVILLDIIMPKLDGFAVLKELRRDAKFKQTPIILLTNLGQDDDIKKGKELGADDYFVKSNHTPADVVSKVKAVLAKKR